MTSSAQPLRTGGTLAGSKTGWLWTCYGVMAILLLAYLVSLLVRGPGHSSLLVDGWMVAGFEILASLLCITRGFVRYPGRKVVLFLGLGMMAWALGDLILAFESLGGASPPVPSAADFSYLGFYPLTYIAIVLFMRREVNRLTPPSWLDGAVAALGSGAVCSAFAFHSILHSAGGTVAADAVNVAYPIGDLLLLSLIVGGTVLLSGRRKAPWILLASAVGVNVVGDTFNLFSNGGASLAGNTFNAIAWPTSLLLMSIAVWIRPRPTDPLEPEKPSGFLLPGLAAVAGLTILFVGSFHRVETVAIGLGTASLVAVGARLALSVRRLRSLTAHRHRQSITDELTSLGNRRHLFHILDAFFEEQSDERVDRRTMAFLFVDLNHFKEINDSFGHAAGDELLRQLGPRLSGSLRKSDLLIRLGGDELAVVLLDADPGEAVKVAQRITVSLSEPFVLDAVKARISASIGIAIAPTDAKDSAELLRCADVAMYRAKLGHQHYALYDLDLDDGGNKLQMADELRGAVEAGAFVLHYQPQVDLRTGDIVAVEALLRWPHPRFGMVPPLQFLPLAEEAGLMPQVTAFVLDRALAQCARWRSSGHAVAMSVNVSATNLLDAGFTELVRAVFDRYALPAEALVLEITETCIISDFERSKKVIGDLKDLGIVVSIDDFGAGFTSLAHLGSLAVKELKLDRTFVTTLGEERTRDVELVRATIELGHTMGLRVVAEGIEDRETLELLASIGCDFAQGFFICKPLPADDLSLSEGSSAELRLGAVPTAAAVSA